MYVQLPRVACRRNDAFRPFLRPEPVLFHSFNTSRIRSLPIARSISCKEKVQTDKPDGRRSGPCMSLPYPRGVGAAFRFNDIRVVFPRSGGGSRYPIDRVEVRDDLR